MTRNLRKANDRCVLAISRIEDFAAWAVTNGATREKTKGENEVLRLKPPQGPVLIWFSRWDAVHATSSTRESRLVRRWIRERGGGKTKAQLAKARETGR